MKLKPQQTYFCCTQQEWEFVHNFKVLSPVKRASRKKNSIQTWKQETSLRFSVSTTPDQIIETAQYQSTWDSLSFLVSLSYTIVINAGGVLCLLVRMCMVECFQAGHGVLCNGANQIVVRNSQSPLRTAERWEDLEGRGEVGAPSGALSHDDIVKQIQPGLLVAAHTFVSGHSLPCLPIQQNPLRAWETPQHVLGNQSVWLQGLIWVCMTV